MHKPQFLSLLADDALLAILSVWHLRPMLQRRFPLHVGQDRDWLRYLAWCGTDGRRDYAILRECSPLAQLLSRPVDLPFRANDAWRNVHSLATVCHAITLHRWSLSGLLASGRSRNRAGLVYWQGARHRFQAPLPSWQRTALMKMFGGARQFARAICRKQDRLCSDEELVQLYALEDLEAPRVANNHDGGEPIRLHNALRISPLPLPRLFMRAAEPILQTVRRSPSHEDSVATMRLTQTTRDATRAIDRHAFGANLIGFSRGELGIGEDIRHTAAALEKQGIPVCILDFAPGDGVSQCDHSVEHLLAEQPLYGINLFCLTGIETVRFVCERGSSVLRGRYNIGLWPWELPDWPANCRHAYSFIDEVWGISRHAAAAHRFAQPRPVLTMGLPVNLGAVGSQSRTDFGLPLDAYLYLFAFDTNSCLQRKNPAAVVAAFQKAFPRGSKEKVGLVLKVSHAANGGRAWRRLRAAARQDKRIILIEKMVRRSEFLALMNCCDCYVSLHRAEGFGRCLAEALLLGKQLVATNYSGNMDFCHADRVALVRHGMTKLTPSQYMWGDGQAWAEPDIGHAAELMRSIRENPRPASKEPFCFDSVLAGTRYAARLREIWEQHGRDAEDNARASLCRA